MKFLCINIILIWTCGASFATNRYVSLTGGNVSPYTNWAAAATNIQDAISACSAGDVVLVSNGVYQTGGVTNWPAGTLLTNRVAINKAIIVQAFSTNPADTLIKGAWDPATNGPAAVRCVYMTNGSTLIGFTLTNGATLVTSATDGWGGGVYCPSINTVISNCMLTDNSAYWAGAGAAYGTLFNCILSRNSSAYGGGTVYGTLYNCTLISNSAGDQGGGAYESTLTNCTLSGNSANANGGGTRNSTMYNCTLVSNSAGVEGGGAAVGTLYNCTLSGNSANANGGGAFYGTLYNCTLTGNSAVSGGGAMYGTLNNCTLTGNSAGNTGGGAQQGTLYNCTIVGNSSASVGGGAAYYITLYNCTIVSNSAAVNGGGAYYGTLYNCTIVGNSAVSYGGGTIQNTLYNCTIVGNSAGTAGGGAYGDTLINSIVYFNSAPSGSNWIYVVAFTNTCTVPAATNGPGNITSDPMFMVNGSNYGTNHVAGNYRLQSSSPCVNAGTNFSWMTNTNDVRSRDLDGLKRIMYGTVDMGAYETIIEGTIFYVH